MKTLLHEGEKRKGEGTMEECWVFKVTVFGKKEEGLVMRLGFPLLS